MNKKSSLNNAIAIKTIAINANAIAIKILSLLSGISGRSMVSTKPITAYMGVIDLLLHFK